MQEKSRKQGKQKFFSCALDINKKDTHVWLMNSKKLMLILTVLQLKEESTSEAVTVE